MKGRTLIPAPTTNTTTTMIADDDNVTYLHGCGEWPHFLRSVQQILKILSFVAACFFVPCLTFSLSLPCLLHFPVFPSVWLGHFVPRVLVANLITVFFRC